MATADNQKIVPEDEYLSAKEIEELRELLVGQVSSMMEKNREAVSSLVEVRDQDSDTLDMAVNESNREFTLRLADRERRLMKKIRHALDCIGEGSYGTCESCGAGITHERLLARPVARLCIDCKTEAEQLEARRRVF